MTKAALFVLLLALAVITVASQDDGPGYDYSDDSPNGPSNWGNLRNEWGICSSGVSQSPINISKDAVVRDKLLHKLGQNYNSDGLVSVVSTEPTVFTFMNSSGGNLTVNGTSDYELVQIRVHLPSEHLVNGKRSPMEVQLIHNSSSTNRIAVVALHYKRGGWSHFVEQLLDGATAASENGSSAVVNSTVSPSLIGIQGRPYYEYPGSLTAPPCTEDVTWYLIRKVDPSFS